MTIDEQTPILRSTLGRTIVRALKKMAPRSVRNAWQEIPDPAESRSWPNLLAVPKSVHKVLDNWGDAWTRTPRGWECLGMVCTSGSGGGGCLAGHPKYGPYVAAEVDS